MKGLLKFTGFFLCFVFFSASFCQVIHAKKRSTKFNPLASVIYLTSKRISSDESMAPCAFKGVGPGFILDKQGHVAIQVSVISDIHSIECSVPSIGYWPAVLLGKDSETGIGVLKIKAPEDVLKRLQPVRFSHSSRLSLGQELIAGGISPDGRITVLRGICSVARRSIKFGNRVMYDLIQTDVFVHEGLNGAPFFDKSGKLIGMGIMSSRDIPPDMGFVIPSRQVEWITKSIIENGEIRRAWFGASFISIDPILSRLLDLPVERGVLLVKVEKGSPADKAGFKGCERTLRLGNRIYPLDGDFITAVDRTPVVSDASFVDILNRKGAGKKVLVTFYRGKTRHRFWVKLGEKSQ